MTIHDIEQGSPEWHKVRCGKFTASKIHCLLMAKSTKGYNDYLNQIAYERMTGEQPESYSNEYMDRGTALEPEAIMAYELATFNKVDPCGFVEVDQWRGCSPDGLVGKSGMVQIKCPKWSTLMDARYNDEPIPKDYQIQMQWEMYCTGRAWSDYFCYHPKLEPILKRLEFDKTVIARLETEIEIAIKEIEKRIGKLKG